MPWKTFSSQLLLLNAWLIFTDNWFTLDGDDDRDSDAYILAGLDDVQSLLDDHILKSQSMRGSPFIAALGRRATDWEEKLIMMQDIMDVWLKVQSTWMYLEPIFNSEDIMRQMPVEGRNFKAVCIHITHIGFGIYVVFQRFNSLFSFCIFVAYRSIKFGSKSCKIRTMIDVF